MRSVKSPLHSKQEMTKKQAEETKKLAEKNKKEGEHF